MALAVHAQRARIRVRLSVVVTGTGAVATGTTRRSVSIIDPTSSGGSSPDPGRDPESRFVHHAAAPVNSSPKKECGNTRVPNLFCRRRTSDSVVLRLLGSSSTGTSDVLVHASVRDLAAESTPSTPRKPRARGSVPCLRPQRAGGTRLGQNVTECVELLQQQMGRGWSHVRVEAAASSRERFGLSGPPEVPTGPYRALRRRRTSGRHRSGLVFLWGAKLESRRDSEIRGKTVVVLFSGDCALEVRLMRCSFRPPVRMVSIVHTLPILYGVNR